MEKISSHQIQPEQPQAATAAPLSDATKAALYTAAVEPDTDTPDPTGAVMSFREVALDRNDVRRIVTEAVSDQALLITKTVLTTDEVARYMGVSVSYINKLTMRREIPFYKPNGKMRYYNREEVEAWLQRNRVATSVELDDRADGIEARSALRLPRSYNPPVRSYNPPPRGYRFSNPDKPTSGGRKGGRGQKNGNKDNSKI